MNTLRIVWACIVLLAGLFWVGVRIAAWIGLRALIGLLLGGLIGGVVTATTRQTGAENVGSLAGLLFGAAVGTVTGIWSVVRAVRDEILQADADV